jgi:acyl-CoA synthetase (NDP forming)
MEIDIIKQLDPIFKARSVAFIGASSTSEKWGHRVLKNVLQGGFRGGIYPVNPNRDEILGLKVYKDVNDVPHDIDLAIFTLLAKHMPEAMERCVKKGIKGGVIISADFAETGDKGRALEGEILRIAKNGGLRFIGPNGMGIYTSAANLNIALQNEPLPGHLAFISQSGTYGGSLASVAREKGFGLRSFVSVGNQADVAVSDLIEYFLYDSETKVIALYLEGVKNGRRFFEVAGRATQMKPILVYKGGSSDAGSRAALSHTASVAGADEIFDAMCRQTGIIRVEEIEHLFIMAEALMNQPLPNGNRIAVIGSGGQGVVAVDSCRNLGLEIPELDGDAGLKMKEILPPHAPMPKNPVDFAGGTRSALQEARIVEQLVSLDYIDGIISNMPVNAFLSKSFGEVTKLGVEGAELLASLPQKFKKPIVTMKFRDFDDPIIGTILSDAGIPVYDTPEDCARAMYALVRYARVKHRA